MTDNKANLPDNFDLTLLANFVHQVVNPLNAVAGTLDNLSQGTVKEENRRVQRLNAARAQLEQCITLIRNLAFLAEDTSGVLNSSKKIILPQIIIESAMFFQEDGKNNKIEINLNDRKTQNMIYGNPELIRQVLINIFDNFIKYGEHNRPVIVEQRIQKRTNMAIIEIKGNSKYPINNSEINKLCHLGFRGENAKKVVASGSGLGLYICKKLIDDHGGSLSINASKSGTVNFLIKLPTGH